MKMLISYLYCNKGGVTSVIKQRMPILIKNGWSVDAVFETDHGGGADLLQAGVHEVHIFRSQFKDSVQEILAHGDYDIHVIFDTPELMNIQHPAKTKVVFEVHTPILTTITGYRSAHLERCRAIFVPSTWSKNTILELVSGIQPEQIRVIPNIVETKIFNPNGEGYAYPNTLLWVGKLAEYKNWEEAMKIGGMFLQKHPQWNFLAITGGLSNSNFVSKMLLEFIDRDRIANFKWLHNLNQEDISKVYRGVAQQGGFLLSTSKAESFCLVVHEAMRCGLPVVSTRVGPIPEVIEDNVSGLMYDLGNLQECLQKCEQYLDQDFRSQIIQSGFRSLEFFDQHTLEELYLMEVNGIVVK